MFKRIIIPILLIIAVSFTSCTEIIYSGKDNSIKNTNKKNTIKVDKSKLEKSIKLSPHYKKIKLRNGYKKLKTEAEKRVYNSIIAHCTDFTDKKDSKNSKNYKLDSFTLANISISERQIAKAVFAVFQDNPQFFWLDEPYSYSYGGSSLTLKLYANMTSAQYKKKYKQLNAVINRILAGMKPSMSEFERELYLHDYLVKNCKYLEKDLDDKDSYTIYGCLVNQNAVCMGYTAAFQLLLSYVGINSITVTGSNTAAGHIWNAVKIEGDWYYTDVTWDDTEDFFMYDNFNITTKQLKRTHKIVPKISAFSGDELFEKDGTIKNFNLMIPKCTADKYNYYKYRGYILKNLFNNNMAESLAESARAKKRYFYIYVDPESLDYNTVYKTLFNSELFAFSEYIKSANSILGYSALKPSVSVTKKKYLNTITVLLKYY